MSNKTVAVIEGDDASPEAVKPVIELIDSLNLGIDWIYPPVGEPGEEKYGSTFPDEAKEMIDSADTTFFGSASSKATFALLHLRWGKQTYANVRPSKWIPGYHSNLADPSGIDFVIVRENLEDMYLMAEGDVEDLAPLNMISRLHKKKLEDLGKGKFAIKVITEERTKQVAKFAFELAQRRKCKGYQGKVTISSKYNMMPKSDGLFMEVAGEVGKDFPDIKCETILIDNLAHQFVVAPKSFDVVLLPNLYGDILSDECAGLVGGLGLAPSGNFGHDYAYFEPVHGTAPDIVGQNIINPTATLLSATMMLDYLGFKDEASRVEKAMAAVYAKGHVLTPDQGGRAKTTEFIDAVKQELR
ncbi:isocitrate/isopropylmalate dehydrogenase family protein [bacterium]|nr:isocitrate/isopropylmalate dehydrogenase family protein [bacterium]